MTNWHKSTCILLYAYIIYHYTTMPLFSIAWAGGSTIISDTLPDETCIRKTKIDHDMSNNKYVVRRPWRYLLVADDYARNICNEKCSFFLVIIKPYWKCWASKYLIYRPWALKKSHVKKQKSNRTVSGISENIWVVQAWMLHWNLLVP